jgi:hypothetical protein
MLFSDLGLAAIGLSGVSASEGVAVVSGLSRFGLARGLVCLASEAVADFVADSGAALSEPTFELAELLDQ